VEKTYVGEKTDTRVLVHMMGRWLDNVHPARRSSKGDFCFKHIKSVRSVRKPLPECGFGGGAGGYCRPERTAKIRNEFVDPQ
jgi:hypothetical protein